jgi:hypothetical protein
VIVYTLKLDEQNLINDDKLTLIITYSSLVSIDGLSVDVFSDEWSDFLSLPLGCHVASTVNCRKFEVVVVNMVTCDLTICGPWSPIISNRET